MTDEFDPSAPVPQRSTPVITAPFWWRGASIAPAMAAAMLSAMLLSRSLGGGALPGCGENDGCDSVLSSRYGQVLNIPVAALAVALYGSIAIAIVTASVDATSPSRRRWGLMLAGGGAAGGAAIWFFAVQGLLLKQWCVYCTITHTLGLLLLVMLWIIARGVMSRSAASAWTVAGLVMASALALTQTFGPDPVVPVERAGVTANIDTGPGSDRVMSVLADRVRFKPHQLPALGDPDAPVVMLYLYDYTCDYCRAMHAQLDELRATYGKQLCIIMVPVPLDSQCNRLVKVTQARHQGACEYAKLAMSVWRAAPEHFEAFDKFLFTGAMPPPLDSAREKAKTLLGSRYKAAMADAWIAEQLQHNITLHTRTGAGVIPRLITGSIIISSKPASAATLMKLLQEQTPLRRACTQPVSESSPGE
jgi:uncharacterized membrane protein